MVRAINMSRRLLLASRAVGAAASPSPARRQALPLRRALAIQTRPSADSSLIDDDDDSSSNLAAFEAERTALFGAADDPSPSGEHVYAGVERLVRAQQQLRRRRGQEHNDEEFESSGVENSSGTASGTREDGPPALSSTSSAITLSTLPAIHIHNHYHYHGRQPSEGPSSVDSSSYAEHPFNDNASPDSAARHHHYHIYLHLK